MSNIFASPALILALAAITLLCLVVIWQQRRIYHVSAESRYRAGYEAGRAELLDSIRYEREIFDTRRSGFVKKETALKVRERVMLGNLRIAEMEREVVLSSEVNEQNVWNVLEQARSFLVEGVPAVAAVERIIAPAARAALSRGRS